MLVKCSPAGWPGLNDTSSDSDGDGAALPSRYSASSTPGPPGGPEDLDGKRGRQLLRRLSREAGAESQSDRRSSLPLTQPPRAPLLPDRREAQRDSAEEQQRRGPAERATVTAARSDAQIRPSRSEHVSEPPSALQHRRIHPSAPRRTTA